MRILALGPDVRDLDRVRCYSDLYAHYVCRELRERGVEIVFGELRQGAGALEYVSALDAQGADHVLALGLRYFSKVSPEVASALRSKIRGAITQMYDGAMFNLQSVDCTFTTRDDRHKYDVPTSRYAHDSCNRYVGWGVDPEVVVSSQDPDELRILVDHCTYDGATDYSLPIIRSAANYVRSGEWRGRFKSVRVRQLTDEGAEDCDVVDPKVRPFRRGTVPFREMCEEYGRTHLYMVTHEESVGQTVLETATAGAMIGAPSGTVVRDRLRTVRAVEYRGQVPWTRLVDAINVRESRARASENSWSRVTDGIMGYLTEFRR